MTKRHWSSFMLMYLVCINRCQRETRSHAITSFRYLSSINWIHRQLSSCRDKRKLLHDLLFLISVSLDWCLSTVLFVHSSAISFTKPFESRKHATTQWCLTTMSSRLLYLFPTSLVWFCFSENLPEIGTWLPILSCIALFLPFHAISSFIQLLTARNNRGSVLAYPPFLHIEPPLFALFSWVTHLVKESMSFSQ